MYSGCLLHLVCGRSNTVDCSFPCCLLCACPAGGVRTRADFRAKHGYAAVLGALAANRSKFSPSEVVNAMGFRIIAEGIGAFMPSACYGNTVRHVPANAGCPGGTVVPAAAGYPQVSAARAAEARAAQVELERQGALPQLVQLLADRAGYRDEAMLCLMALQRLLADGELSRSSGTLAARRSHNSRQAADAPQNTRAAAELFSRFPKTVNKPCSPHIARNITPSPLAPDDFHTAAPLERAEAFAQAGGMGHLSATLKRWKSDGELVGLCLDVIMWACGGCTGGGFSCNAARLPDMPRSDTAQSAFLGAEGLENTVRVLAAQTGSPEGVQACLHVLEQLALRSEVASRASFWRDTALPPVLEAIQFHAGNIGAASDAGMLGTRGLSAVDATCDDIAVYGARLLLHLSVNAYNAVAIGELGGLATLSGLMHSHARTMLCLFVAASVAIARASDSATTRRLYVQAGGLPYLIGGLDAHVASPEAVVEGATALATVLYRAGTVTDLGGGGAIGRDQQIIALEHSAPKVLQAAWCQHAATVPTAARALCSAARELGHGNDECRIALINAGLLQSVVGLLADPACGSRPLVQLRCVEAAWTMTSTGFDEGEWHTMLLRQLSACGSKNDTAQAQRQSLAYHLTSRHCERASVPVLLIFAEPLPASAPLAQKVALQCSGHAILTQVLSRCLQAGGAGAGAGAVSMDGEDRDVDAVQADTVLATIAALANLSSGNATVRSKLLGVGPGCGPGPHGSVMPLLVQALGSHMSIGGVAKYACNAILCLLPQTVKDLDMDREYASTSLLQNLQQLCSVLDSSAGDIAWPASSKCW